MAAPWKCPGCKVRCMHCNSGQTSAAARKDDAMTSSLSSSSNITEDDLKAAAKCIRMYNEWGSGVSTHDIGWVSMRNGRLYSSHWDFTVSSGVQP